MEIIKRFLKLWKLLPYMCFEVTRKRKVYIVAALTFKNFRLVHNNWGDDLNYFFLKDIIEEKLLLYQNSIYARLLSKENILAIGSIIEVMTNRQSVIWGSGCISSSGKIKVPPHKVLAVRGPLTRKKLLDNGIDCPEIYGDPAMLLQLYFNPNVEKKYKIGVIPHYVDSDLEIIKKMKNLGYKIINIRNYNSYKSFVKEVLECEFILSSSLHGIICADSYKIPNIWVEFSNNITGDRFKYNDYYMSVSKNVIEPIRIELDTDISKTKLLSYKKMWQAPKIDLNPLIKSCPFCLKKINYNRIN